MILRVMNTVLKFHRDGTIAGMTNPVVLNEASYVKNHASITYLNNVCVTCFYFVLLYTNIVIHIQVKACTRVHSKLWLKVLHNVCNKLYSPLFK